MKGCLISFEGIEGAGKSTQIEKLKKFLEQKEIPAIFTREPGATELGKKIRKILLSDTTEKFPPISELFLYEADRNIHIHNVIKPSLKQGKIVICDRFIDSTLVYQGYARGLDKNTINKLNKLATENIDPCLTFIFDITEEESQKRLDSNKDRIEKENIKFHKKLRKGYLEIAKNNQKRAVTIDGTQNPEKVFGNIVNILQERKIISL